MSANQTGNVRPAPMIEEAQAQVRLLKWVDDCVEWHRKREKFFDRLDKSKGVKEAREEFLNSMKPLEACK